MEAFWMYKPRSEALPHPTLWTVYKAACSLNTRKFWMVPVSSNCFLLAMKYLRPLCGCKAWRGKILCVFMFLVFLDFFLFKDMATLCFLVLTAFCRWRRAEISRSRLLRVDWGLHPKYFSYKYFHQGLELCSSFQIASVSLTVQLTDTQKVWWKYIHLKI